MSCANICAFGWWCNIARLVINTHCSYELCYEARVVNWLALGCCSLSASATGVPLFARGCLSTFQAQHHSVQKNDNGRSSKQLPPLNGLAPLERGLGHGVPWTLACDQQLDAGAAATSSAPSPHRHHCCSAQRLRGG